MRIQARWHRGILAPLAALALVLAACGGEDTADEAPDTDAADDAAADDETDPEDDAEDDAADDAAEDGAAADFSGELVVWHNYDEGVPGLNNAMNEWAGLFEDLYPDVSVRLELSDFDGFAQNLLAANVAGEPYDVAILSAFNLPELYQAGAIDSITDLWEGYEDRALFPEDVANVLVATDGEQFGTQAFSNVPGMYVNLDLLDELGLEVPTTLEEMEEAMQVAIDAGYVGFSGVAPPDGAGEFNLLPWVASTGWTFDDPEHPGLGEALEIQARWVENGWRSSNDSTGFVATDNFLAGDHLFVQDGNWQMSNFIDNAGFEWQLFTIDGVFDRAALGGEAIAIGSEAQRDMAWAFVSDVLLSEEGQEIAAAALSVPLREGTDLSAADDRLEGFAALAGESILIPLGDNAGRISTLLGEAYSEMIAGAIDADTAIDRVYGELPGLLQ